MTWNDWFAVWIGTAVGGLIGAALAKHAADAFDDALCRMTDLGGEE